MSGAAAPYWRNAGMTYISYANTYAAMVRNCLKEPHKIKVLNREQVYYKLQIYQEGEPHKAGACSSFLSSPPQNHKPLLLLFFFSSASLWQVAYVTGACYPPFGFGIGPHFLLLHVVHFGKMESCITSDVWSLFLQWIRTGYKPLNDM